MDNFTKRLKSLIFDDEKNYQFAARIGMAKSQLSRYMGGSIPRDTVILKIAMAAGVNFDWLKSGHGPKYPPAALSAPLIGPGELDDAARSFIYNNDGGVRGGPFGDPPECAKCRIVGMSARKRPRDEDWAEIIAGHLMDTSLSKYETEVLGDLVRDALADYDLRVKIIEHYRLLKQLETLGHLKKE